MGRKRKTTLADLLRQAEAHRRMSSPSDAARWRPDTGWENADHHHRSYYPPLDLLRGDADDESGPGS